MFESSLPEHTGLTADERSPAQSPMNIDRSEAGMDNFSAGPAHGARYEHGAPLDIGDAFDLQHADDNLGDEAAFPTTWQHMAPADAAQD